MSRTVLAPVVALALACGVLLGASGPAGATTPTPAPSATAPESARDLASFGIAPSGPSKPDQRPFVSMVVSPGTVAYDHVALLNQAGAPIELRVYGSDVVMADGGGLSARPEADASSDAGSWIAVDGASAVTVPAQTDRGFGYTVVPFSISVPTNAEPGDHVGGLVASLVSVGEGGGDTPGIELDQRVVARIYVQVKGDLAPGLEVVEVGTVWRPGLLGAGPGRVTVEYTIRNTGNTRMAVEPAVAVEGPFGLARRSVVDKRVDELLPGGEVRRSTTVGGVVPLVFERVTVTARGVAPASGVDPHLDPVSHGVRMWAVPWSVLALLLLVVAGLVARGVVRKVARKAPAESR